MLLACVVWVLGGWGGCGLWVCLLGPYTGEQRPRRRHPLLPALPISTKSEIWHRLPVVTVTGIMDRLVAGISLYAGCHSQSLVVARLGWSGSGTVRFGATHGQEQ